MADKIDFEAALRLWGPIKNEIDTDSLEFWKALEPDIPVNDSMCSTNKPLKTSTNYPCKATKAPI